MINAKTTIPTISSQDAAVEANILAILESAAQPIGIFSGESDRVVRIRDGKIIPADSGNQGGGQN